jgi:aspartate kinase
MRVTVLKLGGSVLAGHDAYAHASVYLRRRVERAPLSRLVVVVSAEHGATDVLLAEARQLASRPAAPTLDLLWSTGELRSVALLTIALQAVGIDAAPLHVHQTDLLATSACTAVDARRLRSAVASRAVVVVPGFLARDPDDGIVSLGRGGPDLTAVLLARALEAPCELVKDVPGYFTEDPSRCADAVHGPALTYDEALSMADRGCELVQRVARRRKRAGGSSKAKPPV